ncbi:MAG: 4-hydroxy-3-methylbut-2-enyl diphosphate reductase [Porphyromonas sp.]|nr:4-hydroxy-3-methylbut-2-enyl diphosphate reductase [Porphyromonas sp.]
MIDIEIDSSSGFCFGVINAIKQAETELKSGDALSSLGPIVHNEEEVKRLSDLGLHSIDYEGLQGKSGGRVLFRAHGEPPSVYREAKERGIEIIDATCPVVLKLQKRIRKTYEETRDEDAQIVIFGKQGHAEVNGLVGQTEGNAIVLQSPEQAATMLELDKPIYLFSQTTMSREAYRQLIEYIEAHLKEGGSLTHYDTICRLVSNRIPDIVAFAKSKDWIYFIAGRNSSNGRVLYESALKANPHTHFISSAAEITGRLPEWVEHVGICGATSTPLWQMQEVKQRLEELHSEK